MVMQPASAGAGISFVRTDISDIDNRIPAKADAVCELRLGTTIGNAAGATIATIEHLMAACLLYTSPSPRDGLLSRMPSSA